MSYRRSAAVAMTVAGLAAAGCGSSDHAGSSNRATGSSDRVLSRSELVAKTNAVCKRLNAAQKGINIRTRQDYINLLNKTAGEERLAFAELAKLKPPASLQSDWSQILSSGQTLVSASLQLAEDLTVYNRRGARILTRALQPTVRTMQATSERDGFSECAQLG